jgi:hypothetical protein
LMISEPLGLIKLANPCVTRDSSSFMNSEALGFFGLGNPCVTRDSSSLMISEAQRLFGCRIHAAPVAAVR